MYKMTLKKKRQVNMPTAYTAGAHELVSTVNLYSTVLYS